MRSVLIPQKSDSSANAAPKTSPTLLTSDAVNAPLRFTNDIFGSFGSFGGSVAGYPVEANFPAQSSVMLSVFHVFHGKLHRDLQGRQRFTSADSLVKDSKRKPREASKESNPKDIRQCQKQESKIIQIQRREMASSEFGQGLVAVGSFPRNIQYSRFPRNMLDLRYCISLWICRGDARAMSFENRVKLVLTTINCEIETKQ